MLDTLNPNVIRALRQIYCRIDPLIFNRCWPWKICFLWHTFTKLYFCQIEECFIESFISLRVICFPLFIKPFSNKTPMKITSFKVWKGPIKGAKIFTLCHRRTQALSPLNLWRKRYICKISEAYGSNHTHRQHVNWSGAALRTAAATFLWA